jgi:hypothetical protein
MLAGCPAVIEQDKHDGLTTDLNRRLSQPPRHLGTHLERNAGSLALGPGSLVDDPPFVLQTADRAWIANGR